MTKTLRSIALAVALAFGLAAPAHAAWDLNDVHCGGGLFETCLSGTVSYANGVLTLTLVNQDMTGEGVAFKTIGLWNIPAGFDLAPLSVQIDGNPVDADWQYWEKDPNAEWPGATGTAVEGVTTVNLAPHIGLQVGQTAVIQFAVQNLSADQVNQLGIAVHGVSGPGGCSTKLAVEMDGTTHDVGFDEAEAATCVSVPEPMSGGLIMAGLVGLAFVARRRGFEITED